MIPFPSETSLLSPSLSLSLSHTHKKETEIAAVFFRKKKKNRARLRHTKFGLQKALEVFCPPFFPWLHSPLLLMAAFRLDRGKEEIIATVEREYIQWEFKVEWEIYFYVYVELCTTTTNGIFVDAWWDQLACEVRKWTDKFDLRGNCLKEKKKSSLDHEYQLLFFPIPCPYHHHGRTDRQPKLWAFVPGHRFFFLYFSCKKRHKFFLHLSTVFGPWFFPHLMERGQETNWRRQHPFKNMDLVVECLLEN